MLGISIKAPLALGEGKPITTKDTSLPISRKASLSSIFKKVCILLLVDAKIRPEYRLEVQAGDIEEPISIDYTYTTYLIKDKRVPIELANVTIKGVTRV